MHSEPTAGDVESVARRDKASFQRMAVDLLRAHIAGAGKVRGYDLGTGRNDHGFDAEIEGAFEGLAGRIRVSVKGNLAWSDLRKDARVDAERHPTFPLLLVCALSLDERKVATLCEDAARAGVPAVEVVHGSTLAEWLRDAPHLVPAYLRTEPTSLVPVEQALERFAPVVVGRGEGGPWLASELAAVEATGARLDSGAEVVLLSFLPDTRPDRCLWRLARELARRSTGAALVWVRTEGDAALPADAWTNPAFMHRQHVFVAPWGRGGEDLIRWFSELPTPESGPHRLVLAVPTSSESDAAYVVQAHSRTGSKPYKVELRLPADVHELDELVAWLVPEMRKEVHRQSFSEAYGLRPALLELGAQNPELIAARGGRQFVDPVELRALAGIAILGQWPAPKPGNVWLLRWLDMDAGSVDALAHRAEQRGWLIACGVVRAPASRAVRWALVRAWRDRDQVGWERLVQSLGEVSGGPLQLLLPGMAKVELYGEVERFLLGALDQDTWRTWGTHLPVLARSGASLHRRILELAEADLRGRPQVVDLHAVAGVVQLTPLFEANLIPALRVTALLARAGLSSPFSNEGPVGLIERITAPHRLRARSARRALEWLPDALARGEYDLALVVPFVGAWLKTGVGVEESSSFSFTFGTSGWNEANPDLPACWQAAGRVVRWLLSFGEPELMSVGWELIGSAGDDVRLGPSPPGMSVPAPLVDVVRQLVGAAGEQLERESHWPRRHHAERALLAATERDHVDADLAAAVLRGFSTDPLFRAWQLCVDRGEALPDPQDYTKVRVADGPEGARRWRIDRGDAHCDARVGQVADQLVASGASTGDLERLIDAIGEELERKPSGWRAFEMLRAWAERAPVVFEPVVLGPGWQGVPSAVRRPLLWAVAPAFGARLLGRMAPSEGPNQVDGAARAIAQLLLSPGDVPADDAQNLLPALEQVVPTPDALPTMACLAVHPDPWVRHQLALWLYRHLLRHEVDSDDLRALARALCRAPGGLPAIDGLLSAARHKGGQHKALLWEALLDSFISHIHGQSDREAWSVVARNEYSFRPLVWETLKRAPERWWVIMDERVGSDRRGFDDMRDAFRELPADVRQDHLTAAIEGCPFPLDQRMNRRARLIDALVSRLSGAGVLHLVRTLTDMGRENDVRALLISAGPRPELANGIAAVGSRFEEEAELQAWARRVAIGGLFGIHSSRPFVGELPDGPRRDPRVEALRTQACELGGRPGYVLDVVVEAMER